MNRKIYHYAAILLMGTKLEKKYFIINSCVLVKNESKIISLFVEANQFNEDDADNCIGAVRLTEAQYKAVIGK